MVKKLIYKRMKPNYSSVSLPLPLINKIKKTIKNTGYSSVSSFVEDLVRTTLTLKEKRNMINNKNNKISKHVRKKIKERLTSLGYI